MADILDMQAEETESPAEEKGSRLSLRLCYNSYVSLALCFVK
ncbi:SapB/AmfS family lanthipeptide [Nigerium massiliense]|nr:SapB/AmfS family lanthipeptide [Nigerium massiliense]